MSLTHESHSFWRFRLWHKTTTFGQHGWPSIDWELIQQSPITPNQNIVEGTIALLDMLSNAGPYTASWFIGLMNGAGDTTPNANDTAAKITTGVPNPPVTNDWAELTAYAEAARQTAAPWQAATVAGLPGDWTAGKQSATVNFTINAPCLIAGAFLIQGSSVKGGTAGKLYSVDNEAGPIAALAGDVLQVSVLTGFLNPPG